MYETFPILNGNIYGVKFQCGQLGHLANIEKPLTMKYQYDKIIHPQIYVNSLGRSRKLYNFSLQRSQKLGISQNNTFKTVIMHEIAHILEMQLIIKQYKLDFNTEDENVKQDRYDWFVKLVMKSVYPESFFKIVIISQLAIKK